VQLHTHREYVILRRVHCWLQQQRVVVPMSLSDIARGFAAIVGFPRPLRRDLSLLQPKLLHDHIAMCLFAVAQKAAA
jgi:hypothetical protein